MTSIMAFFRMALLAAKSEVSRRATLHALKKPQSALPALPGAPPVVKPSKPCRHCGSLKHFPKDCSQINVTCTKCKKTGHTGGICKAPSTPRAQSPAATPKPTGGGGAGGGGGKGGGKGGAPKRSPSADSGASQKMTMAEKAKSPCYTFANKGECARGKECHFNHTPSVINAYKAEKEARQAKGKGKGKTSISGAVALETSSSLLHDQLF